MADIYQGRIGTISPAFGQYFYSVEMNIDIGITGVAQGAPTGANAANGVTGADTNLCYKTIIGITGIQGSDQRNSNWMY